jgi:methyl-accepting chemotaxis protein
MTQQRTSTIALKERLDFMRLDAATCARLQSVKTIIDRALPVALDTFYAQVQAIPDTRKFFADDSRISGAKKAQLGHWSAISSGNFDDRYFANVRRIGQAHARIGLEPRWYIGGYSLITESLLGAIIREYWPKGIFGLGSKIGANDLAATISALLKAIYLDMDLSISVYMEAAEEARAQQEAEAATRERKMLEGAEEARVKGAAEALGSERQVVASTIGAGLQKLAEKNLTYLVTEQLPEAYAQLQNDFNSAVEQLAEAFGGVRESTSSVHSGAEEIAIASNDLARRTEQQAASLEETAAALDQITITVKKTADGAKLARESVALARTDAERGGAIVRKAVDAMGKIEKSSQQISQIIGVIDEIAFQTNLLALNAGVEAARAGDAGRGFAVVASEVRALAQRSAEAAKEIKGLISTSTIQVGEGVTLVAETGKALAQIEGKVTEISKVVADISSSADEQASSLQQVNSAVNQMDQATQQNAAMSEQATAASQNLAQETERLSLLISEFKVARASESNIRRELEKAAPHAFRSRPPALAAPTTKQLPRPKRALAKAPKPSLVGRLAAAAEADDQDWQEF